MPYALGVRSAEWFWATSIASYKERLLDFMSCWLALIHIVRGCLVVVSFCSTGGKLLRSYWHLFRLAFMHYSWTGRNAVLGQQPKGLVTVSPHHSILDGTGTIWFLAALADAVDYWMVSPELRILLIAHMLLVDAVERTDWLMVCLWWCRGTQ